MDGGGFGLLRIRECEGGLVDGGRSRFEVAVEAIVVEFVTMPEKRMTAVVGVEGFRR